MQVVRFVGAGLLNTMVGYLLFVALYGIGFHPMAALAMATVLGIGFNLLTSRHLVFRAHGKLSHFASVYAAAFALNAIALSVFDRIGLAPLIAQVLWLLPNAAIVYLLQRTFVFRRRDGVL